ncbi:CCR4-NOT transcription complex subunit 1 [Gracilariopsis chorda]|uniref:CCR4-NOT transcription complex subunit 1 n=1 Tax=Gracilariopsis chorda TaxID=448386 RepID=A0A2V3IGD5_9FLOR|nr:CCR4-NOT transcription complex subunit 1 [Gracilariopsis chorda]|eukprot:PXF41083.1 CCR4-NOT transcription complex subunit 1 [Gracilariopsis chorda]
MKFEVQIISKQIGIDLNRIVPSDLLRSRPTPDKTQNPDFATKKTCASPPQTSPPATASSSPAVRRRYTEGVVSAASIFTLSEQRNGLPSLSKPLPAGPSASGGHLNMNHNLLSAKIGSLAHDSVGEISNTLQGASISSSMVGSSQVQRNPLHPQYTQSTMDIGTVPTSSSYWTESSVDALEMLVPNLSQLVTVSPSSGLLESSTNLKRLNPIANGRAIREIIQPVVERSCSIAYFTTKELTSKDFANEHDLGKVRRAAMQMVQQLAASLALVTSKKPLRVSMGNRLCTVLSPSVVADQNMIEQTAQVICNANFDIGCAVIERHGKKKQHGT